MARVAIGRVGTTVDVDTSVCVKTGRPQPSRSPSAAPSPRLGGLPRHLQLLSWLVATAGTSRHYQIDLPFLREVDDRWRRRNRLAWLVGGGGFVISVVSGKESAGPFLGLVAAGLALDVANALIDNVGVRQNPAGELVLTRVHQAAVDAITDAEVALD